MVAAVAGITDIGLGVDAKRVAALRVRAASGHPEDLGIRRSGNTRPAGRRQHRRGLVGGPTDCTTHRQIPELVMKSLSPCAESRVSWLAHTASACPD